MAVAWARSGPEFRRLLFTVRLTTIAAMVVAGLLLWRTALRFGPGVGLTTHALWCFSPTVLSDGSLATLDPWAAALSAVVLWTVVRFLEEPRVARSALVGLALAGAVACKVTTVGLVPLAMAAIAWGAARAPAPRSRAPGRVGVRLAVCGGAMLVGLWALYGFTIGTGARPIRALARARALSRLGGGSLPPGWAADSSAATRTTSSGETSDSGWWWFYLACIALKTTVGAQALALLRGVALVWRRPSATSLWVDVALLSYPALLFVRDEREQAPGRDQLPVAGLSVRDAVGGARLGGRSAGLRARRARPLPPLAGVGRGRSAGSPPSPSDVRQRVGGWSRQRAAIPGSSARLGPGQASPRRVASRPRRQARLLRALRRPPLAVGDCRGAGAVRAHGGRLRPARHPRPPATAGLSRRGVRGLAHGGHAGRAHRVLDLRLPGRCRAARAAPGGSAAHQRHSGEAGTRRARRFSSARQADGDEPLGREH